MLKIKKSILNALSDHMLDTLDAINRSQAIIEFTPDGIILNANENFLKTMKYEFSEIIGKHYSIFLRGDQKSTVAYQKFWEDLKNGVFQTAIFERKSKDGKTVWIQASYNPVIDKKNKVYQ
jgi:methyl-accepting chemotaxis protein